jgi:hypothetical protein
MLLITTRDVTLISAALRTSATHTLLTSNFTVKFMFTGTKLCQTQAGAEANL